MNQNLTTISWTFRDCDFTFIVRQDGFVIIKVK